MVNTKALNLMEIINFVYDLIRSHVGEKGIESGQTMSGQIDSRESKIRKDTKSGQIEYGQTECGQTKNKMTKIRAVRFWSDRG